MAEHVVETCVTPVTANGSQNSKDRELFLGPPAESLVFTGELFSWTNFVLAEILVLAGGAILPSPVVPASTRISAKLKCVQGPARFIHVKV